MAVTLHDRSYKEKKSKHSEHHSPSGRIPFDFQGERKGLYPPFLPADVLHRGLSHPAQFPSPTRSTALCFLTGRQQHWLSQRRGSRSQNVTGEEHTFPGTPQPRSCLGAQHTTPKLPTDQDSICLPQCQMLSGQFLKFTDSCFFMLLLPSPLKLSIPSSLAAWQSQL